MRAPLLLLLAALLAVAATSTVSAHAEPVEVKPGDGAVLTGPPIEVVIIMSQDMARREGANDIDVLDADGIEVTRVSAVIDNANRRRLSVPLPSSLEPGTYTVRWKTLSDEDGDEASGELTFTYDPSGTPDPGRERLRDDLVPTRPSTEGDPAPSLVIQNETGMSWVLVVAVGVGMLALGAGAGYLFSQKRL